MHRWTRSVGKSKQFYIYMQQLIMQTITAQNLLYRKKNEGDFDQICWMNSINNNSVIILYFIFKLSFSQNILNKFQNSESTS